MLSFIQVRRCALILLLLCLAAGSARPAMAASGRAFSWPLRPSRLPVATAAWLARAASVVPSDLVAVSPADTCVLDLLSLQSSRPLLSFLSPPRRPQRRHRLASRRAVLKNACSVDCRPQPIRGALRGYLLLMRKEAASYAQVTSTFYEPRPGGRLHDGYDIGLDAGTGVPAGWAGRVTRLTPWGGSEYGISVQVGKIQVTYGHLIPAVAVGQIVKRGDVVGFVARNHVDIKMLDACGQFVDWGVRNPFFHLKRRAATGIARWVRRVERSLRRIARRHQGLAYSRGWALR